MSEQPSWKIQQPQLGGPERGPVEVILWTAVALETWQMAHALWLVTRATDSRVHWAGA